MEELRDRDAVPSLADINRSNLAHARRKTREAGLSNIDYAQGDILKLGAIDRDFDRIEAVGVLHHLADPQAGWRALLARLRPGGSMRVGLYSQIARSAVVEGRALIDRRRFPATTEASAPAGRKSIGATIARWRNRRRRCAISSGPAAAATCCSISWSTALPCPRSSFLAGNELTFLGFELPPEVLSVIKRRYLNAAALIDLGRWHEFEGDNPDTFLGMYVFGIRKER